MSLTNWLPNLRTAIESACSRRGGRSTAGRLRRRLTLNALEDRLAPALLTVTNLSDDTNGDTSSISALINNPGADGISLREAVVASNNTSEPNSITFAPGNVGEITLTHGQLGITNPAGNVYPLTITGLGAGNTTIDANHGSRIFYIVRGAAATLDGLTLTNGKVDGDGGAILSTSGGPLTVRNCSISGNEAVGHAGGGIYSGSVTVTHSIISDNKAGTGGGVRGSRGVTVTNSTIFHNEALSDAGGIFAGSAGIPADVTVNDSTISGNTAGRDGGGIFAFGNVTAATSTISDNKSGGTYGGGGILAGYSVTISNSTIVHNSAVGPGGGVLGYGAVTVSNSTISGNIAGGEGGGIYTYGYNAEIRSSIVAGNSASSGSPDLTGTPTLSNSIIGGDPMLGPLADNGGPTKTMALLAGSPAIDGGANPDSLSNDQRGPGYARQSGSGVDIGAYEYQFPTNQAPIDIALAPAVVPENQPAGTGVGDFTTIDPDTGDTFTYTLVGGDGSADNDSFRINGSTLQSAASFDFEAKAFYSIRVQATDAGGLAVEKTLTVRVANVNEKPTLSLPTAQSVFEDVGKVISGITVGDPDGGSLTVTLAVRHGRLTLGTITGLSVSGNGSGAMSLSGSIANLNAALAGLVYRGDLNYGGADLLSVSADDGRLSAIGGVGLTVKSAVQQATDLQSQVSALRAARVLTQGQASMLNSDLNLKGNHGDIGKVQQFLSDVAALRKAGVLTLVQAEALLGPGNTLLLSVSRR
jgi:hypothetical protein